MWEAERCLTRSGFIYLGEQRGAQSGIPHAPYFRTPVHFSRQSPLLASSPLIYILMRNEKGTENRFAPSKMLLPAATLCFPCAAAPMVSLVLNQHYLHVCRGYFIFLKGCDGGGYFLLVDPYEIVYNVLLLNIILRRSIHPTQRSCSSCISL